MKILEPIFIDVIERLLHNDVEFLLIGGYAVNYHGYGRYTGDIDLWLRPTEENWHRFAIVFDNLCSNKPEVERVKALNFYVPQVITMGEPPLRVDFLTKVNLISFEEAWAKRVFFQLKNMQVPVVDYHHLITMKFNTGRPQDKNDLEQLQRIKQLKN
jgi:predicted nucleotidyltransferase